MSEIKVNKVSPATGTAITLGDSGDTFTVPSGATIVNSGTATGFGGGKVLQVLQATKTDTTSMASTSWADISGLSQAITPSATSSKILVIADCITSGPSGVMAKLLRGSTDIGIGDADSSRERVSFGSTDGKGGSQVEPWTIIWLDSPSTTSATTYKLQWRAQGGGTHYLNRTANDADNTGYTRSASTITVMEIGA
jgi:hypothetical protein